MNSDSLPYDRWIADALLGVVVKALSHAAIEGLPGDHHYYITFRTDAPGVEIPSRLKAQYPTEMTIVIQHQYWDLVVDSEGFGVTLKFQGRDTRLIVPLETITAFSDPSVNFGLQLNDGEGPAGSNDIDMAEVTADQAAAAVKVKLEADAEAASAAESKPRKSKKKKGEIITLDAFRKK